jgi:hypothetical protein
MFVIFQNSDSDWGWLYKSSNGTMLAYGYGYGDGYIGCELESDARKGLMAFARSIGIKLVKVEHGRYRVVK